MTRLTLSLEQAEYAALLKIAGEELRSPIDQAHFILRAELERRGLLIVGPSATAETLAPANLGEEQRGSNANT